MPFTPLDTKRFGLDGSQRVWNCNKSGIRCDKKKSSYSEEQKLWRLLPTSLNSYQDADISYIVHIISVKLQQKAVVLQWKVKALK